MFQGISGKAGGHEKGAASPLREAAPMMGAVRVRPVSYTHLTLPTILLV